MLEELGVPYEHVASAMPVSREVRQYHKTGKVPVLLEYDNAASSSPSFVLSESVAINTYLADTYGKDSGLVPTTGTRERAVYNELVCCILSELDAQGLWIQRKHEALSKYFGHIPEAVKAAETQFARVNEHIVTRLNPFLMGDDFSAADILYVHCLDWSKAIGWQASWPENVEPYRQMCHQRPGYQRAKVLRNAETTSRAKASSL